MMSVLLTIISILSIGEAQAEEYKAKVLSISDGDSMIVFYSNRKEKIILYGVDCPEIKQDFGIQAKQFTNQVCFGKDVSINEHGLDSRGRVIAEVYLADGSSLNEQLVKQGLAWWSDKYAPGDKTLRLLHYNAKAQKSGLWSVPNPIAPWTFRNGEKSVQCVIRSAQ